MSTLNFRAGYMFYIEAGVTWHTNAYGAMCQRQADPGLADRVVQLTNQYQAMTSELMQHVKVLRAVECEETHDSLNAVRPSPHLLVPVPSMTLLRPFPYHFTSTCPSSRHPMLLLSCRDAHDVWVWTTVTPCDMSNHAYLDTRHTDSEWAVQPLF